MSCDERRSITVRIMVLNRTKTITGVHRGWNRKLIIIIQTYLVRKGFTKRTLTVDYCTVGRQPTYATMREIPDNTVFFHIFLILKRCTHSSECRHVFRNK